MPVLVLLCTLLDDGICGGCFRTDVDLCRAGTEELEAVVAARRIDVERFNRDELSGCVSAALCRSDWSYARETGRCVDESWLVRGGGGNIASCTLLCAFDLMLVSET